MEKKGLIRGLKQIHKQGVTVVEIATDAHSQIKTIISMR